MKTSRLKLALYCAVLLMMVFAFGCTTAGRARMMVNNMRPMMDSMKIAFNRNTDVALARKAMPVSLMQLDGFIEAVPDDTDLLLRAAEANAGYAFMFVQDIDKARGAELQKKARDYAIRALPEHETFQRIVREGTSADMATALAEMEPSDVPALYFTASSWLSYIGLRAGSDMGVTADLPKVELMMERLLTLDETYKYGAIHALLGAYYASRPEMLGGKPEDAAYHFEQAFAISDSKYLVWNYLYARYYAVQIRDRALFVHTLTDILEAPENVLPEQNFANAAVKEKARSLLAETDNFF